MRAWLFVNEYDKNFGCFGWTIGSSIRKAYTDIVDAIINGEGPYLARIEATPYSSGLSGGVLFIYGADLIWMHNISPAINRTAFRFIMARAFRELIREHPCLNEEMAMVIDTMMSALDEDISLAKADKVICDIYSEIGDKYLKHLNIKYEKSYLRYNEWWRIIDYICNMNRTNLIRKFMRNEDMSLYDVKFMNKILIDEIKKVPGIPSWGECDE